MKNINALSAQQLNVLDAIQLPARRWNDSLGESGPKHPTYVEIAAYLNVSRQRAFQLVNKLRAHGWVEPRGEQHAYRDIRLTPEGVEAYTKALKEDPAAYYPLAGTTPTTNATEEQHSNLPEAPNF